MPSSTYNRAHIGPLKKALLSGNVVLLVGAGSSIACGYPGWQSFLDGLEAPLRRKLRDEYLEELRRCDIRTRLDLIATHLGDEYAQIFQATFSPERIGSSLPEWLRLLYDLQPRLILTTNYTRELEQVARFHPSSPLGDEPAGVRWYDADAVARALRRADGRLALVYLHGRFDDHPGIRRDGEGKDWSPVILGEKSYRYAYVQPGTVKERFAAVCQTSTVLLVGASLADEDVTGTFRFVHALASSSTPPHYVVLPLPGEQRPESRAEEYLHRYNLRPIFYDVEASSPDAHGNLEHLLRELIANTSAPLARATVATVGASPHDFPPRPRVVDPLSRADFFQPRPQYRQILDAFLHESDGGVLALIGIGGAGKTSLVRDALEGVLAHDERYAFDGVLVWSFYKRPDPAAFLRNAAEYAQAAPVSESVGDIQALYLLKRRCGLSRRFLFILDGLEVVQIDRRDDKDTHGTLESTALRDFLLWMSQPGIRSKAIITTRFRLPDLAVPELAPGVRFIDVDSLTRPQARQLLRRRGVRGGDFELDVILDHFGTHALTVNHLGGVIANYLDGSPERVPEIAKGPLTRFEVGQTREKLQKVLAAYQRFLAQTEPAVRSTLQLLSVLPRPASEDLLERICLGKSRRPDIVRIDSLEKLRVSLSRLVALGLVQPEQMEGNPVYSIHPAVKDLVTESLGTARLQLASAARDEMRAGLDEMAGRPGVKPNAPAQLDYIEDLIGLHVEAGDRDGAFDVYWSKLGSYEHVGKVLGDYARGERCTARILASDRGRLQAWKEYLVRNDRALYLATIGRLRESAVLFRENASREERENARYRAITLLNVAEVEYLLGRLSPAQEAAEGAFALGRHLRDAGIVRDAAAWMATALFARGEIKEAAAQFKASLVEQRAFNNDRAVVLYRLRGFYFQLALLRLGRIRAAARQAAESLRIHEEQGQPDACARSRLIMAEAARLAGDELGREYGVAEDHLRLARDWALKFGDREVMLWSQLVGVRVALDAGDLDWAEAEAGEALRAASACEFGLLRIDLRNALARVYLELGSHAVAIEMALKAEQEATSKECQYRWGRLEASETAAEAYRLSDNPSSGVDLERTVAALRAQQSVVDPDLEAAFVSMLDLDEWAEGQKRRPRRKVGSGGGDVMPS